MADFLTPVSQTYRKSAQTETSSTQPQLSEPDTRPEGGFKGVSPDEALETLKSQPSYDTLVQVLKYLSDGTKDRHPFDIRKPSPKSAQIVHAVVTEILPNYWTVLDEPSDGRHEDPIALLLGCLQSLTGINAVLSYMRILIREARSDPKNSHHVFNLSFTLALLGRLLQGDDKVGKLWRVIASVDNAVQLRPMRQELISILTSGKIISLSAEAEDVCRQKGREDEDVWMADAKRYLKWLANNLTECMTAGIEEDDLKLCAEIASRTLRLGHAENFVKILLGRLLLGKEEDASKFSRLLAFFPPLDQKKVLYIVLKLLSDAVPGPIDGNEATEDYPDIWAASGAIKATIGADPSQKNNLLAWLSSATGAGIGEGCGIRRAAVAVLADHKEAITTLLEKSMNQFGDQLYIRHAPSLQQEAHAQVLLLSAGYVHRISPIKLTLLLRSSSYLNAISNRIGASHNRARFLGMVVGEALSGLVHGKEMKLDFKMDEMDTDEAQWYKSLVHIADKVGPLDPLRYRFTPDATSEACKPAKPVKPAKKTNPRPSRVPPQTGFVIEEVVDDEEEEDPDLVPYAKPDSDAEDSDDDPTLINRDKPKAPVYIRDLISYLRDTESYDKQKLALNTAPILIRRKADYGTEVSSHAEELASLFVGLQDKYDLEEFERLRLQGMVAIITAQPKKMGPWFAKTFFDGDYSLAQRASILIAIGLSGREIAGFEISEYAAAAHFPSKTLPTRVEKHYIQPASTTNRLQSSGADLKALPPNALDKLATSLSQTFLAPMAAEAADAVTGPDALKLSSFRSRLQSQSTSSSSGSSSVGTRKPKAKGVRSIPNTSAALLATSFFFPLTSRFQAATRSSTASARGILFHPYLLPLYLKTLALLLHAAGPSTLALPQMTTELWDILLGIRTHAAADLAVTQALLFALVALLDVNEADMRGLCQRHGREVVESMEWAGGVFENTRGGGGTGGNAGGAEGDENEVKMLAAGVLIRLREAVEKYQALLMGDLIGF
ncbi:telomere length regulation protein-domain-containing protein [Xylariomycetidae sp. FL0641]|nr:telomere length regulation protein-domain-containing protein [Xylariomycetidae sp. FL0641]